MLCHRCILILLAFAVANAVVIPSMATAAPKTPATIASPKLAKIFFSKVKEKEKKTADAASTQRTAADEKKKEEPKYQARFDHKLDNWNEDEEQVIPIAVEKTDAEALIQSLEVRSEGNTTRDYTIRFADETIDQENGAVLPGVLAKQDFNGAAFRKLLLGEMVTVKIRPEANSVEFEFSGANGTDKVAQIRAKVESPLHDVEVITGMLVGVADDGTRLTLVIDGNTLREIATNQLVTLEFPAARIDQAGLKTHFLNQQVTPHKLLVLKARKRLKDVTISYTSPVKTPYKIALTGELSTTGEPAVRFTGWTTFTNNTAVDWSDAEVVIQTEAQGDKDYVWTAVYMKRGETTRLPTPQQQGEVITLKAQPIIVIPILDDDPKKNKKEVTLAWDLSKPTSSQSLMADQIEFRKQGKVLLTSSDFAEYHSKSKSKFSLKVRDDFKELELTKGEAYRNILLEATQLNPNNGHQLQGVGGHGFVYQLSDKRKKDEQLDKAELSDSAKYPVEIELAEDKNVIVVPQNARFTVKGNRLRLMDFGCMLKLEVLQTMKDQPLSSIAVTDLRPDENPGGLGWLYKVTHVPKPDPLSLFAIDTDTPGIPFRNVFLSFDTPEGRGFATGIVPILGVEELSYAVLPAWKDDVANDWKIQIETYSSSGIQIAAQGFEESSAANILKYGPIVKIQRLIQLDPEPTTNQCQNIDLLLPPNEAAEVPPIVVTTDNVRVALLLHKLLEIRKEQEALAKKQAIVVADLNQLIDRQNVVPQNYSANLIGPVSRRLSRAIHTKRIELESNLQKQAYLNARLEAIAINAENRPAELDTYTSVESAPKIVPTK